MIIVNIERLSKSVLFDKIVVISLLDFRNVIYVRCLSRMNNDFRMRIKKA